MQSYKELIVYKKSYLQALKTYELTKAFPSEERYGMIGQFRRAAMSIPLNIAEGYGKSEQGREVVRFLSMARGSSAEMEVLLEFAKDLGYISRDEYKEGIGLQQEIGKMLTGLIQALTMKS